MELYVIGLSLIIIAWIEQIYRSVYKRRLSFSPFFLAVYTVGALVLTFTYLSVSETVIGALNAVTAVLAFILLIFLIIRRKKPGTF